MLDWQRAVIKVGSSLIAPDGHQCSAKYLLAIARFITASREQGKDVILVSSGSVAAGRGNIAHGAYASMAEKQAMAAVGQTRMMANWARFFDFPCAQVLLTYDDLHNRTRYVNIKNTLRELLKNQVLAVVNENDTVAINELKVGDNDNLGAYTAMVAEADILIICSDVDGLYDADPRKSPDAKLLPEVSVIDDNIMQLAGGVGSSVGTGGMQTKLQAAQKCASSGIQTVIVNGTRADVFEQLQQGLNPGTLFHAATSRSGAKAQWLRHLKSRGQINIDHGAGQALQQRGASLLPSGIQAVDGQFSAGDAIDICCDGQLIAKGISLYSHAELLAIRGLHSDQIQGTIGYTYGEAAVHRDDMVLV